MSITLPKNEPKHYENLFRGYKSKTDVRDFERGLIYEPDKSKVVSIHPDSKIATNIDNLWQKTSSKWLYLDSMNYSVYTGTSGVALLKLKWLSGDSSKYQQEILPLLPLNSLNGKEFSFLCGDAGPLAIGAIVYHKMGNEKDCNRCVSRLLEKRIVFSKHSNVSNEVLYGRAGYLYALLLLNKTIIPPPVDERIIRNVIELILYYGVRESKSERSQSPLLYKWYDSYYVGAAHGLAGILYMLLQAAKYLTNEELTSLVRPSVDYLATLTLPDGNYPSIIDTHSELKVQWCHGPPGLAFVFSMAYKVFNEKKYLKLALDCGETVWNRGILKKGYSLCHGVAGNAYTFLELYQTTFDKKHLYRAIKFAEYCVDYSADREGKSPDRPLSLFEGNAGRMYLLLDIVKPLTAKFPGFTL